MAGVEESDDVGTKASTEVAAAAANTKRETDCFMVCRLWLCWMSNTIGLYTTASAVVVVRQQVDAIEKAAVVVVLHRVVRKRRRDREVAKHDVIGIRD